MFLQNVMDVLANPNDLFEQRADQVPIWQPLLLVVAVATLGAVVGFIQSQHIAYPPEVPQLASQFGTLFTVIIALVAPFISWLLVAAVLHGLSALFGADRGDFLGTVRDVGWGYAPGVIFSVLQVVATWFALQQLATPLPAGSFQAQLQSVTIMQVTMGIGILVTIWQGAIWTFAIRHGRGLSLKRAAIVVGIPVVALVGLSALPFVL